MRSLKELSIPAQNNFLKMIFFKEEKQISHLHT